MSRQNEEDALREVELYKQLQIVLPRQASLYQSAYNEWALYMKVGDKAGADAAVEPAVTEYSRLQELEAVAEPLYEKGYNRIWYERPDISEVVHEDTSDPWADWKPPVISHDVGKKGGF